MIPENYSGIEMRMLFYAIELGLAHLFVATLVSVLGRGLPWGVGPRDEGWPPMGKYAARIERSFKNFLETFPFFLGAVLFINAFDAHSQWSALGAPLYFWGRLAYIPLYVIGIPFTRTLAWTVATVGIVMVLSAALTGT